MIGQKVRKCLLFEFLFSELVARFGVCVPPLISESTLESTVCIIDAVGSWQIILPMPNLERPY